MAANYAYIYEFAGFRLIPLEGLLLRNGEAVALQPRAFAVLTLLVELHGHLVPKSELIEKVWNDTVVEEAALSRCVWTIRQALGEASKSSRFIQTIPRRGYRFVAPVTVLNDPSRMSPGTETISIGYRSPSQPEDDNTVPASISLRDLSVRMRFGTARALAAKVGIAVLLLGGVVLYLALGGHDVDEVRFKRGTDNEDAYRNYQEAMTLLDQQRPGSTERAREYLDRAVDLDPNFAKAWAGKAYAYSVMWSSGRASDPENVDERYEKSMQAAKRSLAIDPKLSEAYTSLCENKFAYEFNADEAEKDCKRAIDLDPHSPLARRMYSMLLISRGRSDESLAEIKTAMELEPVSLRNQRIYANALYYARRYQEAIEVYRRLFDLNPDAPATHLYLIRSLERSGREAEALEILIKLLVLQKKDDATIERFKAAYASSGWRGVLNERIKTELQEKSPQYSLVAENYGLLGEKDRAFGYLKKNTQKRGWMKMFFRVDPRFDPLRDDPRFDDLTRQAEGK